MWQKLLRESSFFLLLLNIDRELAEEYRRRGCACGGRLHRSAYIRKPRGGLRELPAGYDVRESFCCGEEGCRRRVTPPSVRFLGRRVYLGAVVVVVSAMAQGVTAQRASSLRELCGVSVRTLRRWRQWWLEWFVRSALWRELRGRFVPPVVETSMPASVLERIEGNAPSERALRMLQLLLPLTAGTNCVVEV